MRGNIKKLKVLAIVSNWQGANDLSFANGFEKNECKLYIIDRRNWLSNRLYDRLKLKYLNVPNLTLQNEFNNFIIKTAIDCKPDIVFISKGLMVTKDTISELQQKKIIVLHWHPDDAFNSENSSSTLNQANSQYDFIITPKSFNVKEYKNVGAKDVIYLPYAFDPEVHKKVDVTNEEQVYYGSDIAFVGTNRKKRAKQLGKINKSNLNLQIWGGGWHKLNKLSDLRKSCMFKEVPGPEMSMVFNSSKIILGFLNAENRDLHTARTYEIPACRGFFLAERTEEQSEILREGIEADYFSSDEEMIEKAKFYLNKPSLITKIAQSGYDRVHSLNATYESRVKDLLEYIFK